MCVQVSAHKLMHELPFTRKVWAGALASMFEAGCIGKMSVFYFYVHVIDQLVRGFFSAADSDESASDGEDPSGNEVSIPLSKGMH